MFYLLLSACASVCVAILLKHLRKQGLDSAQLVTWNYLAASALCALVLQPNLAWLQSHSLPWPALVTLALVLPSLFLALVKSLSLAGLVKTEVAQRLSLLLSLAAAFIWFNESFTLLKALGLALGLGAVLTLLSGRSPSGSSSSTPAWPWLLMVWGGYALVDVLLKYIAAAGMPFSLSLQVSFGLAFMGMFSWQAYRHATGRCQFDSPHLLYGLLLGGLNFTNIALYIKAHQQLADNPAVVFASMNMLVVVLGTLAGVALFKERLLPRHWLAITAALVAITLLAISKSLG